MKTKVHCPECGSSEVSISLVGHGNGIVNLILRVCSKVASRVWTGPLRGKWELRCRKCGHYALLHFN